MSSSAPSPSGAAVDAATESGEGRARGLGRFEGDRTGLRRRAAGPADRPLALPPERPSARALPPESSFGPSCLPRTAGPRTGGMLLARSLRRSLGRSLGRPLGRPLGRRRGSGGGGFFRRRGGALACALSGGAWDSPPGEAEARPANSSKRTDSDATLDGRSRLCRSPLPGPSLPLPLPPSLPLPSGPLFSLLLRRLRPRLTARLRLGLPALLSAPLSARLPRKKRALLGWSESAPSLSLPLPLLLLLPPLPSLPLPLPLPSRAKPPQSPLRPFFRRGSMSGARGWAASSRRR
mmetsp:Transcript_2704/g.6051  ORF Transcript_2704/g.6051 Transcript_2704/m.6051 type:complete len:293 (-) Transcript_2704:1043-1921(-)